MFEGYQLVDLTLTLDEKFPCTWPGAMIFQKKKFNWYEEVNTVSGVELNSKYGAYFTEWIMMDEHVGTHFDAPSHFIPPVGSGYKNECPAGMITGDKVDLGKLFGSAVVIDVTQLNGTSPNGESPYILPAHVKEWEDQNGPIVKDQIVLFYSGWDTHFVAGKAGNAYGYDSLVTKTGPGWPAPSLETVRYLYERGVKCIGTDGTSMGSSHDGAAVHVEGLSKEIVYVEGLCQLDKLACRGNYFIFLPIKVAGSSGGPGRAIAFVPKVATVLTHL